MRAMYLVRTGDAAQAFELRDAPTPEPGAGQARIAVDAFGLNYADVSARQGLYQDAPPMPSVIGYEVVGRVDALGSGVEGLGVGQRVTALTRFGGYATHALTDARAVAPIAEDMDVGVAAALPTQGCIAADVDPRRRLVDVADLESRHAWKLAREEGALHRLRELLLLLVEAGVVDRAALPAPRRRSRRRLRPARAGAPGRRKATVSVPSTSPWASPAGGRRRWRPAGGRARGRDGRPPARPCRAGAARPASERSRRRARGAESGCGRATSRATTSSAARSPTCTARAVSTSLRSSGMRITAASASSSSTIARRRRQGRFERQALGEGLRHRVEAAELPGGQPLGLQRALEDLESSLRALVQARVLDGDRELPGERQEQLLPLPGRGGAAAEDREGSDRLVADEERDEERPADAALLDDALEPREARVGPQVLTKRKPRLRKGPSASSSSRSATSPCGAVETAGRPGDEAALVAQVDGDLPARGQLGNALDRDLERVRQREPGDRLADDRDERLRAPERRLDLGGVTAAAQRERRSRAEGRQALQPRLGSSLGVEGEPERRGGRLSQRHGVEKPGARARRAPVAALERAPYALGRLDGAGRSSAEAVRGEERRRRPFLIEPPERSSRRADGLGGEPHDLPRGLLCSSVPAASASPSCSSWSRESSPCPFVPLPSARSSRTARATCAAAARASAASSRPNPRPERYSSSWATTAPSIATGTSLATGSPARAAIRRTAGGAAGSPAASSSSTS